jgi:FMN hydrolase / 5-amino-6-(5-phospho-D-ribitylamino)uracil phosphatase
MTEDSRARVCFGSGRAGWNVMSGDRLPLRCYSARIMQDRISQAHRLRRIRAISFDGDMTLWDFDAVMRHSLSHTLTELQAHLPANLLVDLTIDRMIEIRDAVAEELRGHSLSLEEIRLEAFVRTLQSIGVNDSDLAARLNAVYLKHRFQDIQLYPDVLPAFAMLRNRYMLGLVSNGNSYPERCGLDGQFAFVVFAHDVGFEKPHPAMFQGACRKAGCAEDEFMHVGDSVRSDVEGAKAIGAFAVWLNRSAVPRPSDIEPDFEIGTLLELNSLLARR